MSTRSRIGIYENDKVTSIYCHFDGYIEHNGEILFRCYTAPEQIKKLIALGDLSCLGETIGDKVEWERRYTDPEYYETVKDQCIAYHRDRGEELVTRITDLSAYRDLFEEYNYLFKDGKWYVACGYTDYQFEPLENYIA